MNYIPVWDEVPYKAQAGIVRGIAMKVIALYHIPRGICVLLLNENQRIVGAKLRVLRSLCAS